MFLPALETLLKANSHLRELLAHLKCWIWNRKLLKWHNGYRLLGMIAVGLIVEYLNRIHGLDLRTAGTRPISWGIRFLVTSATRRSVAKQLSVPFEIFQTKIFSLIVRKRKKIHHHDHPSWKTETLTCSPQYKPTQNQWPLEQPNQ